MTAYPEMTAEERRAEYARLQKEFDDLKARGLSLNMARGKPGKAQLDLVSDIFGLMQKSEDYVYDGSDVRNYGERTGLPAARFGDSEKLTVGDKVYAIGNPLGYELRGTLTDGIVSAINRDVWVDGRTMTLIQTNAALNSGNSGGPLINEYGQVVGINTIKMSSSYSNIEGLGFAIPSSAIRRLVNDLLTSGQVQPEPVLGVTVMSLGTQLGEELWGVEVQSVTPGSAAEQAGVQVGDFVVAAGGIDVVASRDLLRARRQYHVGDEMPMTLWRDGTLVEVTLVLEQADGENTP